MAQSRRLNPVFPGLPMDLTGGLPGEIKFSRGTHIIEAFYRQAVGRTPKQGDRS